MSQRRGAAAPARQRAASRCAASLQLLLGTLLGACGGGGGGSAAAADTTGAAGATPVQIARVRIVTLPVTVSGPGQTDVLREERIRAPFSGVLTSLHVVVGDHVRAGETLGSMVEQNSYAALQGAQAMRAAARTPAERRDAARALQLAREYLVHTPLTTAVGGVVVNRSAGPGERLAAGDTIVSIAATGSLVFIAAIPQPEVARVHAGQTASIAISGRKQPLHGMVQAVLPADSASRMTVRVRIAIRPADVSAIMPITLGLSGTATIVVGRAVDVPAVPHGALLRNDVTGKTRMALVGPHDHAHWIDVLPGVSVSGWVEIVYPLLPVGQRVIISGQVGLPDGARVVAAAPSDTSGGPPLAPARIPAAGAPAPATGGGAVVPGAPGRTPTRPPRGGARLTPTGSAHAPLAR